MSGEFDSPPPIEEFPVEIFEDRAVIGIPFEVNMDNAPDFKARMLELLANEELQTIAVDMQDCGYVDTSFFGVLVGSVKRARVGDRQITIRGIKDQNTRKMFEISGFDKVFEYEDEKKKDK